MEARRTRKHHALVSAQRISQHESPPGACSGRRCAREAGVGGDRPQRRASERNRLVSECNRARRSDEWRQAIRLLGTVNGTTRTGTYDDQDRLQTYGPYSYTYTPNGELFTKTDSETGDVWTYHYDALGNLLSVDLPDGKLIEYVIDGQNRRIGKKVDGVLTKAWLYKDQLKPIAELDGSGNLVSRFIYGSKTNTPDVVMKYNAGLVTTYRIVSDHLGSPVMAVNVNNVSDVPFTAEYSAFGERTVSTGASSEGWMPFGFAGGMYDADTGLTRFGERDYDAVVGRWTQKDPMKWGGGQTNFYNYVGGDPIDQMDPTGTILVADDIALICAAFAAMAVATAAVATVVNSKAGQDAISKTKDWFERPKNTDECYPQYLADTAYCGETYADDYRYDICMTNAWNRYIRCLNGLGPSGPLVPW
jgi:RHS repeat-associated protein